MSARPPSKDYVPARDRAKRELAELEAVDAAPKRIWVSVCTECTTISTASINRALVVGLCEHCDLTTGKPQGRRVAVRYVKVED